MSTSSNVKPLCWTHESLTTSFNYDASPGTIPTAGWTSGLFPSISLGAAGVRRLGVLEVGPAPALYPIISLGAAGVRRLRFPLISEPSSRVPHH